MNRNVKKTGFTPIPMVALLRGVFSKISEWSRLSNYIRTKVEKSRRSKNTMPALVSGFSLVELVVVLSVMVIITGLVLARYRGYGKNATFANSSEGVVLAIREAQVYGVGVKGQSLIVTCAGGVTKYDCGYGVYFSTASPQGLTLFVDKNSSGKFDSASSETLSSFNFDPATSITDLQCDMGTGFAACPGGALNLTFKRPNPSATIMDGTSGIQFNAATITISNGADTSIITITKAGQLSLQ